MSPKQLRNKRIVRSIELSSLASLVQTMAWMQYSPLETELTPQSLLLGMLQLLAWRDIHHLVCTERAHRAYHQARTLLRYGRRRQIIDSANSELDNCDICLTKLHGYCSNCVMCHHTLICAECVFPVTKAALADLPFPCFHSFGVQVVQVEDGEWMHSMHPVRPGDVLCLICCPAGATETQLHKVRLHGYYCDLTDGMQGLGAWSPLNSVWGKMVYDMIERRAHVRRYFARQVSVLRPGTPRGEGRLTVRPSRPEQ